MVPKRDAEVSILKFFFAHELKFDRVKTYIYIWGPKVQKKMKEEKYFQLLPTNVFFVLIFAICELNFFD